MSARRPISLVLGRVEHRLSVAEARRIVMELLEQFPLKSRHRIPCVLHDYQEHGGEAEELRQGIEKLLLACDDDWTANELQRVLDEVDARDSLAFVERPRRRPKLGGG